MDIDLVIFVIFAIVVLLCFTIFALLYYSGLFYEPIVLTGETPWKETATIAYKFIKGPYNGIEVGSTFTEVTSIAPQAPAIGIFYDDPSYQGPFPHTSIIGCIIKENVGHSDEILHVTDEQLKLLSDKEFKIFRLPNIDAALVTDFVYTTPFSIWLAPSRVYPRLQHHMEERSLCAYPFIEIYKDCKVLYAAPLSKQKDFFVEEYHAKDSGEVTDDNKSQTDFVAPTSTEEVGNCLENEDENDSSSSTSSSFEEINGEEAALRKSASPEEKKTKKDD